jgi:predicted DNA-binding protein with PD1-like motif
VLSSLRSVARAENLADSSFKAIGALSQVELGWFNWETKKYQTAVKLEEQVELLSLIGDIALKDGSRKFTHIWSSGARTEPLTEVTFRARLFGQLAKS